MKASALRKHYPALMAGGRFRWRSPPSRAGTMKISPCCGCLAQ